MPIKTKFKEWLEDESYTPFVIEAGHSTNTLLIKIAKNDNFDYLYQQTYYHGSHIERDEHLVFGGIYCKKDGQIYCAYNHFKRLFPEIDENKGQYQMADEVQRYTSGKVGYVVLNNPDIYSTLRPISEQAERKLSEYNECYVKGEATNNFFAGVYADSLEYESNYQFKGWNEENLLEYILNPGQFIDDEAQRYLEEHLDDILLDLRKLESLKEHLAEIEYDKNGPLHQIRAIKKAVEDSGAQTVKVTILKNGVEFSFKTATDTLRRTHSTYSRWDIPAAERREYENLFKFDSYRPEEIMEISYRGKAIYTAEPYEPVQDEGLNQIM